MKNLILFTIPILFIFLGCGCKLAKEPSGMPYKTMKESKNNNAFIAELKPQQPFIEIEGNKHFITAAWIEHPHNQTNWGDEVWSEGYCFAMELEYNPNLNIDLKQYIQELGNGPTLVWFFLTDGLEKNDSIKLKYRSAFNQEIKCKNFWLYKK